MRLCKGQQYERKRKKTHMGGPQCQTSQLRNQRLKLRRDCVWSKGADPFLGSRISWRRWLNIWPFPRKIHLRTSVHPDCIITEAFVFWRKFNLVIYFHVFCLKIFCLCVYCYLFFYSFLQKILSSLLLNSYSLYLAFGLTLPTLFYLFIYLFIFCFLGPHKRHMEIPGLGVQLELQLPAYATATATWDPSCGFDLHHSSRQRRILNPLSEARDRTRNLIHFRGATRGTLDPPHFRAALAALILVSPPLLSF